VKPGDNKRFSRRTDEPLGTWTPLRTRPQNTYKYVNVAKYICLPKYTLASTAGDRSPKSRLCGLDTRHLSNALLRRIRLNQSK